MVQQKKTGAWYRRRQGHGTVEDDRGLRQTRCALTLHEAPWTWQAVQSFWTILSDPTMKAVFAQAQTSPYVASPTLPQDRHRRGAADAYQTPAREYFEAADTRTHGKVRCRGHHREVQCWGRGREDGRTGGREDGREGGRSYIQHDASG